MTKKVRTYSTEFKAQAVKKIANNNVSATAYSRDGREQAPQAAA